MNTTSETLLSGANLSLEQGYRTLEKIITGGQPVYGEPVTTGAYTVITASEIVGGGGFGSGVGFGREPGAEPSAGEQEETSGGGGGMGGGGYSMARPVAVITAGPDGVQVRPVVDVSNSTFAAT